MNIKTISSLTLLIAATLSAAADPQKFDFKDPKGVNNAVFKLDAPLESINGTATGVSGEITFDPANPKSTTGKIVVATSSMNVPNPMMKEHLLSDQWMDAKKYPDLSFEVVSLADTKTSGPATTASATGKLTIKGITKEVTIPVSLTFLKDKLGARIPNMAGDLLVVRANFKVKRSDYNINAGQYEDKVSDEIELSLSLAGMSPKPK